MYAAARHLHGAVRAKARSHVLPAPHWTRMRLARCRGGAARSFGTAPVIARATQAVPFGAFALFGGGIAGLGFVALHRTTAEEATSRVLHEPISMAQGDAESFPPDRTELGVGESDSSERDGSSVEQHTDDVGDSDAPGGDHDGDSVDDCEDEAVGESGAPAGAAQAAREDGDVTSNLSDESAAAPAEGEQAQESSNTHEPAENSDENDEVSYEHPFWKLLKNPMLWVAVGSTLLSSVAGLYIPTAVGTFLDLLQTASAITDVWQPAMAIGGVALLHGVLHMCSVACVTSAVERMAADLRCQLFTSIISRDISFFDEENTAKLVQKITSEVDQLRSLAKHVVSKGLTGVTALIGGTAAMYTASPQLSIATLAVIAPMIAVGLLWTWTLAASSSQGRKKSLKAAAAAQEIFGSVRTVRSFGNESLEVEFYERLVEESCKQNQRHGLSLGIFFGATATALMWASLFSLVYGGMMVIDDSMKLGKLASFLMSTGKSRSGLTDIGILWGEVQDGISTLESVMAVLSSTAHQQWVLKSVNLSLAPGRVVALVGSSGAGKSTVCQLLERFYDVQGGAITLDGLDIADIDPQWLRSQIGVVSQEPVLFQRSIKENIRYGDPSATDEQVVEAAKMANCHQFITMFPDGYNTVVGERGAQLSGGQKQRIAIARAILRNPRILILDEATSSLDNASEAAVQEALSRLMRGRTVLVVAHRLSTVKDADEIVVLRSGARVESGTYDELMARNGVFALLARREQRGDVEP